MGTYFIIIQTCSFLGLVLSAYLLWQKSKKRTIICPFKDQCNEVLYSKYSQLFGVPTLAIGVLYYAFIFGAITCAQWSPESSAALPWNIFLFISVSAVIFSLYQTAIQLFILKKWCSWCLESAILSIIIMAAVWRLTL